MQGGSFNVQSDLTFLGRKLADVCLGNTYIVILINDTVME